MSNNIIFSGTGELTQAEVASKLTTQKYVTIEGYNSIGENAFKNKTDILTVTISKSVTTIGQGAFAGNNCNNITLPIHFFDELQESINMVGVNVDNDNDNSLFSPAFSNNPDFQDVIYYTWLFNLAHSLQASSMGSYHTISNQRYYGVSSDKPNAAWITNRWGTQFGWGSSAKGWASYFLGTASISSIPLDQAKAALTISGTKYNFTCELTTNNNGFITTDEVKSQINDYTPGLTLGGIVQSITPSLDITFNSTVTSFDSNLSFYDTNISSVLIPDIPILYRNTFVSNKTIQNVEFVKINTKGFNNIGSEFFMNCTALQYISLPNYITSINNNAFTGCVKLLGSPNNNILNLEYISSIGNAAFQNCVNLVSVFISETNLLSIGSNAFTNCSRLQNIILPTNNNYITINDNTFQNCSNLLTMTIPKNIKTIGNNAFSGCSKLNTIYLNNGLTTIGINAFSNCNIEIINTPPSITAIKNFAFDNCNNLSIITLPVNFIETTTLNESWKNSIFGDNSNVKLEYYYIFAPQTSGSTILTREDVFMLINKYKLSDIYTIGTFNVYIADNVTVIDKDAFKMVKNILTISLGNEVQEIGSGAFEGSGLQNFYIGTTIESLNNSKLTTIGESAFNNCNIETIIIPPSVTDLGAYIFYNATKLKQVNFSPNTNIKTINAYSFANCISLDIIRIPRSIEYIDTYAFAYCKNLFNLILSKTLKTIGEFAFIGCSSLSTLSLPYGVVNISNNAFGDIPFKSNSYISVPSSIKNNINSIFYNKIYTGSAKTQLDIYEANKIYYQFYIWIKNGMTGIAASSMGSSEQSNHTLGNQKGYFGSNSSYIQLYEELFPQSALAKPYAKQYIKVNENTGSSTADINIQKYYVLMKNSLMRLSTMNITKQNINSNVFDYHYILKSDTTTLTRQQVITQIGSDGTINRFTASLDDNITEISNNAFENMKIGNIEFNNNIKKIGENAFYGSSLIGTLTIPSSVETINNNAFMNCSGINIIILQEGNLTTIGSSAFSGCEMSNIYIPKSVNNIGTSICKICPNLTTVTLPLNASGNVPSYNNISSSELYFKNNKVPTTPITFEYSVTIYPTLITYTIEHTLGGAISIPVTPYYIITSDMVNNVIPSNIPSNIPITVLIKHENNSTTLLDKITIDNNAFQNKINLYRVTMYNVSTIRENAFNGCSGLKSISLENSIETINIGAFTNCNNLQTVKIPSRLNSICNNNYFSNSNFSASSINYLYYCILKTESLEGILTEFDVSKQLGINKSFNSTISIIFDTSVTIIDNNAFNGNNYIDTIIIPNHIQLISAYAFANCLNLASVLCVNNNSNLTQIGKSAFNGCINLTTVHLPLSLLDIELGAFLGCTNLWDVTLPKKFDYDLLTMNNLYFESNMMKNESWQSDNEWAAEGSFFTFNFQLKTGKYCSYSWAKNNYMAQQRAKQASKVADHEKVMDKWDEVGEVVTTIIVIAAITVIAPYAIAGVGSLLTEGAADAAVTAGADASTDAAVDAGADASADAGADAGADADDSIGAEIKKVLIETTLGALIVDKLASKSATAIFGFTPPTTINTYNVEQLANREKYYGSMNGIYTVPSNYLNTVTTENVSGSWKILTTINVNNHIVNLNALLDKYFELINTYNPTRETNISITSSHLINNELTHIFVLTAIIPTDYSSISNKNKLAMTESIENELLLYLGISSNSISTIITDIPSSVTFPFPMIIKNKRLFGLNQKISSGVPNKLVFTFNNWK